MPMPRLTAALMAAAAVCSTLPAMAAPLVDQQQTSFNFGGYLGSGFKAGQSWTAGATGLLAALSVYVNGYMNGTNTVSLTVRSGSTVYSGSTLGSGDHVVDTSRYDLLTDEFRMDLTSLGIMVAAGDQLNFEVSVSGSGDLGTRGLLFSSLDPYADGAGNFSAYGNFFPGTDLTFKSYVDADVGTLPEPAPLALLGLAVMAAGCARRSKG